MAVAAQMELADGASVAIVGGGPAGSFFGYFAKRMADRLGRELSVDLYEPRDYTCRGPKGCNMCGGIVSESLMQNLAAEGIHLPPGVIQRRLDSYQLHMDVGSVRISTPAQEMRIAAVARGAGPKTAPSPQNSFDAFLLDLARQHGVEHVPERVSEFSMEQGRPRLRTRTGLDSTYDLLVCACGVNSGPLAKLKELLPYEPPATTRAYVAELQMGRQMVERYLGSSMHVFILDVPRLEFAALIPKGDFVTLCLLGDHVDREVIDAFMNAPEVAEVLPPHWHEPKDFCHCSPRMNVGVAHRPYGDRVVFVGDCGATRLYKDGIGAAFRTAKAAARTALFHGVSEQDFRKRFWPTCRSIERDNRLGKLVFGMTGVVQRRPSLRRALWRMTSAEQRHEGSRRRMSRVLWDTFTGSATYRSVLRRALHPAFGARFATSLLEGLRSGNSVRPKGNVQLATGTTGLTGKRYQPGDVIYEQGAEVNAMFVVEDGAIELLGGDEGRQSRVTVLGPGAFFGGAGVFGGEAQPFTARANEPSVVVALRSRDLMTRVHEEPAMAFKMIEAMAGRISALEQVMIGHARRLGPGWEPYPELRTPEARSSVEERLALATGSDDPMGREFDAGEVIYKQGDRGDAMYVVHGGTVEVLRREGENEFFLAELGEGEFFGEGALFDDEVRPDTVRAVDRAFVFTLERNGLLVRIHEDPSVAFQLIENMFRRVSLLERGLARSARSPVSA
jgi:CRP-like cAMP-binding protein/flavin-dependent dehydrogenase